MIRTNRYLSLGLDALVIASLVISIANYWPQIRDAVVPNPANTTTTRPLVAGDAAIRLIAKNVEDLEPARIVLLYASATCTYCNNNIAFYQRMLSENADNKDLTFWVVTEDDQSVIAKWVQDSHLDGVHTISVPASRLRDAGLLATPTVVLTDRMGKTVAVWYGELAVAEEEAVIRAIKSGDSTASSDWSRLVTVTRASAEKLAATKAVSVISMVQYGQAVNEPVRGASTVHISRDEINVRHREIPNERTIVLDCFTVSSSKCMGAGLVLRKERRLTPVYLLVSDALAY